MRQEPLVEEFELIHGVHSTHLSWKLGVWFENEKLGGMAVHYGYPSETWLMLFSFGHNTFAVGIARKNFRE